MTHISVRLNDIELYRAAHEGARRRLRCIESGMSNPGRGGSPWDGDIEGACAELAVAKYLGSFWHGTGQGEPDIADNIEVRHSVYTNGHLLVREKDNDDYAYVLVTGRTPRLTIRGWIRGFDAKDDRFIREEPGVWWVPQGALNPMEEIKNGRKTE